MSIPDHLSPSPGTERLFSVTDDGLMMYNGKKYRITLHEGDSQIQLNTEDQQKITKNVERLLKDTKAAKSLDGLNGIEITYSGIYKDHAPLSDRVTKTHKKSLEEISRIAYHQMPQESRNRKLRLHAKTKWESGKSGARDLRVRIIKKLPPGERANSIYELLNRAKISIRSFVAATFNYAGYMGKQVGEAVRSIPPFRRAQPWIQDPDFEIFFRSSSNDFRKQLFTKSSADTQSKILSQLREERKSAESTVLLTSLPLERKMEVLAKLGLTKIEDNDLFSLQQTSREEMKDALNRLHPDQFLQLWFKLTQGEAVMGKDTISPIKSHIVHSLSPQSMEAIRKSVPQKTFDTLLEHLPSPEKPETNLERRRETEYRKGEKLLQLVTDARQQNKKIGIERGEPVLKNRKPGVSKSQVGTSEQSRDAVKELFEQLDLLLTSVETRYAMRKEFNYDQLDVVGKALNELDSFDWSKATMKHHPELQDPFQAMNQRVDAVRKNMQYVSMEQLLSSLSYAQKDGFMLDFIRGYKFMKIPSEDVFKSLEKQYQEGSENVRTHILQFIDSWSEIHNFNKESEEVKSTIKRILKVEQSPESSAILKKLESRPSSAPSQPLEPNEYYRNKIQEVAKMNLDSSAAKELLDEYTSDLRHLFGSITKQIELEEFVGQAWLKENKNDRSPNIADYTAQFNRTSHSVQRAILDGQLSDKERAKLIAFFIRAEEQNFQNGNFAAAMAIHSGLQATPIHRLRDAWDHVSEKDKDVLKRNDELRSKNYKKLKSMVSEMGKEPHIPFLPMLQSALVFTDENPSRNDKNEWNVVKLRLFADVYSQVKKGVQNLKVEAPRRNLREELEADDLNEDELYELSLAAQPSKH